MFRSADTTATASPQVTFATDYLISCCVLATVFAHTVESQAEIVAYLGLGGYPGDCFSQNHMSRAGFLSGLKKPVDVDLLDCCGY